MGSSGDDQYKLIHFLWCTEWPFRCLDIGKAPKNMHLTPALLACRSDDVLAEKRHRAAHTLEEATVATPTQGFTNILLQFRTFKSHLQDHPGSYILLLFTHQNRSSRIQSFLFIGTAKLDSTCQFPLMKWSGSWNEHNVKVAEKEETAFHSLSQYTEIGIWLFFHFEKSEPITKQLKLQNKAIQYLIWENHKHCKIWTLTALKVPHYRINMTILIVE